VADPKFGIGGKAETFKGRGAEEMRSGAAVSPLQWRWSLGRVCAAFPEIFLSIYAEIMHFCAVLAVIY